MTAATISSKLRIVIPKEVRERLGLRTGQRLQVFEKGGVITLVREVRIRSLRGFVRGIDTSGLREKTDRV